jgi:hypothetical protein
VSECHQQSLVMSPVQSPEQVLSYVACHYCHQYVCVARICVNTVIGVTKMGGDSGDR